MELGDKLTNFEVCHQAPYVWKFFKIVSVRVRDIKKTSHTYKYGWLAPAPPTLPVILDSSIPYRA